MAETTRQPARQGRGNHRKERKIHMKYEIYQLKEDTMERVKLRFMASD